MPFRKDLERYIEDLSAAHGENLVSVIFYGSAILKEDPKREDIHLLIVLKQIASKDLSGGAVGMKTWMKGGYPAPVYFSESELSRGADVFPIEFNHMRQAHEVVHGKSVLAGIEISNSNIRHQVEFELRSKLLRLRRAVIETSPKPKDLINLMANSLPSFIATMRAAVLLKSGVSHVDRAKVLNEASVAFGLDADVFNKISEIRTHGGSYNGDAGSLFDSYLAQIEKVIKTVDSL